MTKTTKELILSSIKFTVIMLLVTSVLYQARLLTLTEYILLNALDAGLVLVAIFVNGEVRTHE